MGSNTCYIWSSALGSSIFLEKTSQERSRTEKRLDGTGLLARSDSKPILVHGFGEWYWVGNSQRSSQYPTSKGQLQRPPLPPAPLLPALPASPPQHRDPAPTPTYHCPFSFTQGVGLTFLQPMESTGCFPVVGQGADLLNRQRRAYLFPISVPGKPSRWIHPSSNLPVALQYWEDPCKAGLIFGQGKVVSSPSQGQLEAHGHDRDLTTSKFLVRYHIQAAEIAVWGVGSFLAVSPFYLYTLPSAIRWIQLCHEQGWDCTAAHHPWGRRDCQHFR